MEQSIYGPYPYTPITARKGFRWPNGKRLALWVIPNLEFFHLDDPMPGANNERIEFAKAKIPNIRNWTLRDYGNRVGVWRLMDMMARHGIRGTAAVNSDVCIHHPQIIERALKDNWEFMGHCQTNAIRLNEIDPASELSAIKETLEVIRKATGKEVTGWLGAGLAETWNSLDHFVTAGCKYVADWAFDDLPFKMSVSGKTLYSIPYTIHCNDTAQYFDQKATAEEFGQVICKQFDTLYEESADIPRVMAVSLHPFVSGAPYRIRAVDAAFKYICSHDDVWLATGPEILKAYIDSKASY